MPQKPPIFIGGAGRSGTTLLRVILDSHPNVACGPELKVSQVIAKLWYDFQTKYTSIIKEYGITAADTNRLFADLIKGLLEKYRLKEGKERIAEKTPSNINIFPHLHEMFPDSPLIHVIRDGRDVVASLLSMNWQSPDGKPMEYTRNVKKAAKFWVTTVTIGRRFAQSSKSASKVYYEVRYEDIVNDPEKCLKPLFDFIDEPWEPIVLEYHKLKRNLAHESSADQVYKQLYSTSIGRWKNDLSPDQLEDVKHSAGALLDELDYNSG